MAYPTPLKYCLDLPQVNGGCCHRLRSETTRVFTRHNLESQTRRDSERIGFLVLREEWIGEVEQKQLDSIPRKTARCYGCRTNFIVIWEKYTHMFNWPSIIDERYAETFFNSYHYILTEEFKLADEDYNQALSAAAANKALNPAPSDESKDATESEAPRDAEEPYTVEQHHVEPSSH